MEATVVESKFKTPKFLQRASQPYPNVHACVGNTVGHYRERDWWYAKGKAREDFQAIEQELRDQLHAAFKDTYCSSVHFQLFMIGRGRSTAKPTIMFFCDEKDARKKAKKVVDDGGLLQRLPGFRTGHQAKQPDVRSLVQPATQSGSEGQPKGSIVHTNVYYDPSQAIRALGMPIYVKHGNDFWQQAIAYALSNRNQTFLMSVSHVFLSASSSNTNAEDKDDSDFDFGSDTNSEENISDPRQDLPLVRLSVYHG
jgi:hypothetical protein